MRIIDLDTLDLPGKTMIMKVLDKYEKEHHMDTIKFPVHDYDAVFHYGKEYFEVKERGQNYHG